MRKEYIAIFLIIPLISLSNLGYCKWRLINKTPPIEGKVTNATTGEPIENVVISCEWVKEVPAFVDTVRKGFAHEVAITDKQGIYKIPSKRSWHFPPILCIGSSFSSISINIAHPLYSTPQFVGAGNEWVFIPSENRRVYKSKDGIIHYDIELLSLEGKYGRAVQSLKSIVDNREREKRLEKIIRGDFLPFIHAYDNGAYFLTCEDRGIRFDLENISGTWESIARSLPINKKVYEDIRWHIRRTKTEIQKKLLLKRQE